MPDFSLLVPPFLRFYRSRSLSSKPSPLHPLDHADTAHFSGSGVFPASSSRPLPKQSMKLAPKTSQPSAPGYTLNSQTSTGRLFVRRAEKPLPQLPTYTLTATSQQYSEPEPLNQSLKPQHQNIGMFNEAQNFSATGNFVYGNVGAVSYHYASSDQFMKEFLEKTIIGAEFDSSDRDPPPRCHPGTRLAILKRCLYFISNCDGIRKIRWVVGGAGVGKSAIMQNVAESPELTVNYHASVFFSINGRNDGTKVVVTLSYQLAAKSALYRQVIEHEITRDPSLLRSSMAKQFKKLIVEPFIHKPQLKSTNRVLIVIDGLDECHDAQMQLEFLRLISDLCLMHPSSPLIWLVASRPERHITSFFSRHNVIAAYEKEEIPVDSDEARADVERFLYDKLTEIRDASPSLDLQWPEEQDFWKLADAAGGLFAYAQTAIRYIGDSTIGSPALQLSEVLSVIDDHLMTDLSREDHPMALLDALYDRILSNVPAKIMINTRKLLLALALGWDTPLKDHRTGRNFIVLCNWLGMTRDEAYAALNHLYSVLYVPRCEKAHKEGLEPCHKSFIDYIREFFRSGFSRNTENEGRKLMVQCALRILEEAPDGVNFSGGDYEFRDGVVARGPGTGDQISLTWLADEEVGWNDNETRLSIFKLAIGEVVAGIADEDPVFSSEPYIHLVTTQFEWYSGDFPFSPLYDLIFDESRRSQFMTKGALRETPLDIVDISEIYEYRTVKSQFRCPATVMTNLSDPWDASDCRHERECDWNEGVDQQWRTTFSPRKCRCFLRLKRQLEDWKSRFPGHAAAILFTSSQDCCVEFRFVDPKDGVSEWTYWFWCRILSERRKKYGIPV